MANGKTSPVQQLLHRSRRLLWLLAGLMLVVLAATIVAARQQLRGNIRAQIAGRDGEVLHAVALMHLEESAADADLLGSIEEPENQLTVMLKTSRLKGVIGARLFDARGRCVETFPINVLEASLNPRDLPALRAMKPVSHFRDAARLAEVFLPETTNAPSVRAVAPLLEVNVPLHTQASGRVVGIAQFILEGQSIAAEFAQLDRHLTWQALAAFGVSGALLLLAAGWGFRRLRHAHGLLAERTNDLVQANQELALAAKTSAVGAVTSHLIHGLKNPLAGLQGFVAGLGASASDPSSAEWQEAIATTRRMQGIINQVVTVLREQESDGHYEITMAELSETVTARVLPLARERGVEFSVSPHPDAILPNRSANLAILILINLIQNAVQATPAGKGVRLLIAREEERLVCEVRDEGSGVPAAMETNLFAPCQSTKDGGCGIGLAISKQLANHLGASLELKRNSPQGCVFALALPCGVWTEKNPVAASVVK